MILAIFKRSFLLCK